MARFRVEIMYDMGMSKGGETHEFSAKTNAGARQYMKDNEGGMLSAIKRDVHFKTETLSRMVEG